VEHLFDGVSFDGVSIEALRRRRTVKWSLFGPDVLAAWVAEMDFDVAPPIRTALLEAVDREDFGYAPADLTELTTACSEFLASAHGWEVPPSRIFAVADVVAGIAGALDEFVPPACGVVVPTPAYPPFFEVVALGGREVVEVPLVHEAGRPALDLDAIADALDRRARAVLLCNPHNPTGRVFDHDELVRLAEIVDHHGARVVADELHAPLVYPGRRHAPYASVSAAAAEHTVTVTSASKAWNLAGLKCAQVVTSNHADAARWRALPFFKVAGPAPLGIAASIAAYRSGDPWRRELVAYLDGNRRLLGELLAAELPAVEYREPEATYLAWLDCSGLGFDDPAGFFLEHARVALNDGPPFGAGYQKHVRLNFATSRALLERIVRAMGAAVRASHADAEPEVGHRLLPHTADVIVEAWAPTRDRCLEELVRGFVAAFAEVTGARATRDVPVTAGGSTDEDVIVALLDEVLTLLDAEGLVVTDATLAESPDGPLHGTFRVAPVAAVAATGAVPKGVSRSGLHFGRNGTGWRCRVCVDV